jgi:hypothetical protein
MQFRDAGILKMVTPADVLAGYADLITDAIRWDVHDREPVQQELELLHWCSTPKN